MDEELSEILTTQRSLGVLELRATVPVEVAGVRLDVGPGLQLVEPAVTADGPGGLLLGVVQDHGVRRGGRWGVAGAGGGRQRQGQ